MNLLSLTVRWRFIGISSQSRQSKNFLAKREWGTGEVQRSLRSRGLKVVFKLNEQDSDSEVLMTISRLVPAAGFG